MLNTLFIRHHVLRAAEGEGTPGGAPASETNPGEGTPGEGKKEGEQTNEGTPGEGTPGDSTSKEGDPGEGKKEGETETEYTLSFSESFTPDEHFTKIATPIFKESGLDGAAGGKIVEGVMLALIDSQNKQLDADDAQLKEDWGADYTERKEAARTYIPKLANMAGIPESDLAPFASPKGMRVIDAIKNLLENKGAGDTTSRSISTERVWAESVMSDPNNPDFAAFHNPSHPRFREVNSRYNKAMGY